MKRLLFIAHRVPYPPDKGERVRAFHEIKALAQHFRVTLAALAHTTADVASAAAMKQWCEAVHTAPAGGRLGLLRGATNLLLGRSATEGYFASRGLARAIREAAAAEPFDVVVGYSSGTLPLVLSVSARVRIMDLVDADSAKWAEYAGVSRWPKSLLFRREARAVARLELRAVEQCDAVVLVSPQEAAVVGGPAGNVTAIANGVDTDYFAPQPGDAAHGPALVFTGTMDYWPNVQGVCWFVREVWPEVKLRSPELTFTIVGRDPAKAVRDLARVPGIRVTGSVPDVRPYLAEATIAVVPLRIARGVQNKVLEAMAMGRAVVASPGALEGLEVEVGREALSADSPRQWRDAIHCLLADDAGRVAIERKARECVSARYRWSTHMDKLVSLCEGLLTDRSGALDIAAAAVGEPGPFSPRPRPVGSPCTPGPAASKFAGASKGGPA